MSALGRTTIIFLVFGFLVGYPVISQANEICSKANVETANDPTSLSSVLSRCLNDSENLERALIKIKALPLPIDAKFKLGPYVPIFEADRVVTHELVFFDKFNIYPTDSSLQDLSNFIRKTNENSKIEIIRIVGGEDVFEEKASSLQIAKSRAEFVYRYFVVAGLPIGPRVDVEVRKPRHYDMPEEHHNDRRVEIQLVALRRAENINLPNALTYGELISELIKNNILWPDNKPFEAMCEIEADVNPDGLIVQRRVVRSLGHADWCPTVLKAVDRTERIPLNAKGWVPRKLQLIFRP